MTTVRKGTEIDMLDDINDIMLISKIFDTLLRRSDLSEDDANELDHKMKREITEKLGWR
jgi:hypothetical protein